jgi:hypothetical protein
MWIVPLMLYIVKKFGENCYKFSFYKGINTGKLKMCQKAIFEHIFYMKIIKFPTYFMNYSHMLIYFDLKIYF